MLTIVETHPVQYHAPVYRMIKERFNIPVTVLYESDFSITGYRDPEFGVDFAWDTDLVSGYDSVFLSDASASSMAKTLRKIKPKAVLIPGYGVRLYRTAFYEAIKNHYPVLFRAETTDHAWKRSLIKSWVRDAVLRRLYKKCDRLLYVGQRSLRHFKRLGSSDEKLIFSPYCVDQTPFKLDKEVRQRLRPELRKNLGIPEEHIVLTFSGKLSRRKGPDLLLEAVKEMPEEIRRKLAVLFIGDGELKAELDAMSKKEPQIKTVFAGFKNQTEISGYYHASDLLALPSRHSETWGLVVNEALHHGLPCVASEEVGCLPDLIEPGVTGEVCKADSVLSLTAALQRGLTLLKDPDIMMVCRRKVEGYTIEKAASGIAKAYAAVAGGRT